MITSDFNQDASDRQPIASAGRVPGADNDDAIAGHEPAALEPSSAHADAATPPHQCVATPPCPRPATPAPVAAPVPPPVEVQASAEAVKSYIERCVAPQIKWYSGKAMRAKTWHYRVIGAQVTATASIPVFNMLTFYGKYFTIASTIGAAISGIATGAAGIGKFKEHWTRYRQTATTLENLQLEYELCLPPFNGANRNNLLISSVRKILGDEQKLWLADVKSAAPPAGSRSSAVAPVGGRGPSSQGSDDDDGS